MPVRNFLASPNLLAATVIGLTVGAGLTLLLPVNIVVSLGLVLSPCVIFVGVLLKRRKSHRESLLLSRHIEEAVHQERERIYRNLHDDLGAQLLSLVYQAPDEKMADQARMVLQSLREDIARTLDKRLTLLELLGDLRTEMETRLSASNIVLHWQVPLDMTDSPVQVQNVITISRIIREAVSNVIKHADASEVSFQVRSSEQNIEISISDNGSGMASNSKPGRGLESMSSRAEQLGGELVFAELDTGCRVDLMLPR